jgi:hypothetical protein
MKLGRLSQLPFTSPVLDLVQEVAIGFNEYYHLDNKKIKRIVNYVKIKYPILRGITHEDVGVDVKLLCSIILKEFERDA